MCRPVGWLSLALEGQDAFCNACVLDIAQVQVTCQPDGALQHIQVQPGSTDATVLITAHASAQGEPKLGTNALLQPSSICCIALQDKLVCMAVIKQPACGVGFNGHALHELRTSAVCRPLGIVKLLSRTGSLQRKPALIDPSACLLATCFGSCFSLLM